MFCEKFKKEINQMLEECGGCECGFYYCLLKDYLKSKEETND